MFSGGSIAEWFRALDSKSGSPWFKSSSLPLRSGFVLGSPEFNSPAAALCKQPTGQPRTSWFFIVYVYNWNIWLLIYCSTTGFFVYLSWNEKQKGSAVISVKRVPTLNIYDPWKERERNIRLWNICGCVSQGLWTTEFTNVTRSCWNWYWKQSRFSHLDR